MRTVGEGIFKATLGQVHNLGCAVPARCRIGGNLGLGRAKNRPGNAKPVKFKHPVESTNNRIIDLRKGWRFGHQPPDEALNRLRESGDSNQNTAAVVQNFPCQLFSAGQSPDGWPKTNPLNGPAHADFHRMPLLHQTALPVATMIPHRFANSHRRSFMMRAQAIVTDRAEPVRCLRNASRVSQAASTPRSAET